MGLGGEQLKFQTKLLLRVLFKQLNTAQRLLAKDVAIGKIVDGRDEVALLPAGDQVEDLVCKEDRVCVALVLHAALHCLPQRLDQGLFVHCGASIHT